MIRVALCCVILASAPGPFEWPIVRVVDGDTLQVKPPWLIPGLDLSIRVLGIDTPEKPPRAQCASEAALAKKASDFTSTMVAGAKHIVFTRVKWDKYGGRILARVEIDGKDLSAALVAAKLAKPYHGEKKSNWCK